MASPFRWNVWNMQHATRHGVSISEAELVVRSARPPYPRDAGEEKMQVWGRGHGGRLVQVVYLTDPDGTMYIIHARPLTPREKRLFKRHDR